MNNDHQHNKLEKAYVEYSELKPHLRDMVDKHRQLEKHVLSGSCRTEFFHSVVKVIETFKEIDKYYCPVELADGDEEDIANEALKELLKS